MDFGSIADAPSGGALFSRVKLDAPLRTSSDSIKLNAHSTGTSQTLTE
jgi:hypothetical protein